MLRSEPLEPRSDTVSVHLDVCVTDSCRIGTSDRPFYTVTLLALAQVSRYLEFVRLAIFCKSYRNDLERFARLLDSFERNNPEKIAFVVSLPRRDTSLFIDRIGIGRIEYLTDEEILGREMPQSWITQQWVKFYAWRQRFADAWLVVDSDSYFIRPLKCSDFIDESGAVAFVGTYRRHVLDDHWGEIRAYLASEAPSVASTPVTDTRSGKELGTIPPLAKVLDRLRKPSSQDQLARIQRFFGRQGTARWFMPGPIWTVASLASLHEQLLQPRGLSFEDLIGYSPWESVWLGEWELYRGLPGRFLIDPLLLHIYKDTTILHARNTGLTEAILSRRYLGLTLAARHQALESLDG